MKDELTGTIIENNKIIFGEAELTNLVKTLIHIYQFRSKNQSPKAVVFPDITEVDGVKVEFPTVKPKPKIRNDKDG